MGGGGGGEENGNGGRNEDKSIKNLKIWKRRELEFMQVPTVICL